MPAGPVVVMKVPPVKTTVPPAGPGPVPPLPAFSVRPRATPRFARSSPPVTLPLVSVIRGAPLDVLLRTISVPAHIEMLPSVVVMPVVGLRAFLTTFILRPPLNKTLPLVVVISAFTLTSRPQHTTRLPLVVVTAALMFTSLAASNDSVVGFVGVQVSAEFTLISPNPPPGAPAFVVVTVILVPLPASNAVLRAPASTVATLTPEFGVKTLPINVSPVVPAPIVTSAGSSSHVPGLPLGAPAFTRRSDTSSQWPEVSIRPPSPPCAPPRAEMLPETRVESVDHSTTVPPLPWVIASAAIVESALI